MPTTAADPFDHHRRSAAGCLCCGNESLLYETQIVSGFLAARAWGGPPEITRLAACPACGLRFFDRGLSDAEAERYYRAYRDAEYVRARWRWEPFYTSTQHAALLAWSSSAPRIEALREALAQSNAPHCFASALDHGGDRGHMLTAVNANRKAVFDPSTCATLPGIERYSDDATLPGAWDLILSCQVLEHVSAPDVYLRKIGGLLAESGWLYLEVPAENWRPAPGSEALRAAWLRQMLRCRPLLMAADLLCTASRIKLGRLPPLGFVAMREHLNYFTADALNAILTNNGFTIDACGINRAGQLFAVARKFATSQDRIGNTAAVIT
ncbi:MAG: class I SAM-dependent methyltransferase [Sulfuritalea sp.]|nr:class I SAM-dependent methyltransferase [Sulfuritalea sp.]